MKKRLLSLALAFVLAFSLLPTAAWAAGTGAVDNPIEISSEAELQKFRTRVNKGEKTLCAKLTADIQLTENNWTPFAPGDGDIRNAFGGTFDGNGHTISGLSGSNGLFGFVNGATIKNLKVEGTISGSTTGIGGIVGITQGLVRIENCVFSGKISANYTDTRKSNGIGGIVGRVNNGTLKISNCMNIGDVQATGICDQNGVIRVGGVLGLSAKSGTIIESCYSSGTISGNTCGGITGALTNRGSKIENCCWTQPDKGNGIGGGSLSDKSSKVTSATDALAILGDAFKVVDGKVVLAWEAGGSSEPQTPGLSISSSNGSTLWTVEGGNHKTTTVLTVKTSHMGEDTPAVTWKYPQDSKVANIYEDDENPNALVVDADGAKGGQLSVTASVEYEGEPYTSKPLTITVIPNITSVAVKDAATGSNQTYAGATVKAHIYTGGSELDPAFAGLVSYQWYSYDSYTPKYKKLDRATGETYQISEGFSANQILVEVKFGGETACAYQDSKAAYVTTGAAARLEADKAALTRAVLGAEGNDIKSALTLSLPTVGLVNQSTITWKCEPSGVIDTATGQVTLPESGKVQVTITATFRLKGVKEPPSKPFTYTVWSQAAVDKELSDQQRPIKKALEDAEFGEEYLFRPDSDTDENILAMFREKLSDNSIEVSIKAGSVERYNGSEGTAGIDEDGKITYFYIDNLDDVPASHGTVNFNLTFVLSKDGVSLEYPAKAVFGWDKDQVRAAMEKDICGKLTAQSLVAEGDSADAVTQDLTLPFNVNGRTWAQAAWTSSNTAVLTVRSGVGAEPAVGVIRPAEADTRVTLTARYAFTYDDSITLSETFDVVIKAKEPDSSYQRALDAVFGEGSLTDAASGERLAAANGVFNVRNDIQFPTTRDLGAYMMAQFGKGFDGKYTPLVITSSDPSVIKAPDVANAACVAVYRPAVDEEAKTVTLAVKILDRPSGEGRDYASMPVLAEKCFTVTVQPLTEAEITNELALMAEVKAHYWDGIKNENTAARDVTGDLAPFVEVYKQDGALVWVRDVRKMKNSGIVPVAMNGWQELEAWRLFRSSNPAAVTHENLLVTQQFEGKAVTVTSALSSETLGRYGELYRKDPETYAAYAELAGLYYQPVSAELVVRGRNTANMVKKVFQIDGQGTELLVSKPVKEKVTVSFTLSGNGELWLGTRTLRDLDEGVTVFDVLRQLRKEGVLGFENKGGYVQSITCNGKTLAELDEGKNSGWLYTVNGELPDVYMSAYGLKNGDSVRVYFTKDYTKEPGADRWKPVTPVTKTETVTNADGSTTKTETKPDGTTVETTTKPDGSTTVAETKPDGSVSTVEKRADGTEIKTAQPVSGEITASVSVPKSVGSTRVDIPVSKPTGSMVAVIVHPDGTEEIVRGSVVTETGIALRAEGDVRLKIIDNAKRFNDMANHWAKDAVEFASSRELFNGVGNDAFGPDRSMTRGMVSTVLARLAGADTAGGETWYAKGTVWAVENGISDGTAPEQPVTREQLAAMLYRYAGSPAVSGELGFDDTTVISIWAYDAVRWCVDNGILNGVGGNRMAPQDLARRGQVAAMLMRFLQATV